MVSESAVALHSFVLERYSPLKFDSEHVLSDGEVDSILEAARRAPSAGNSQPWAFIVGRRGDEVHQKLVRHLARSSGSWAPEAALLIANIAQRFVEDSDIEYSEFAHYDLGQAVAHMSLQAHTLGLAVHQFRAFNRDAVTEEFRVPGHLEITTMAAVGLPDMSSKALSGAGTTRERRPINHIVWDRSK